MKKLIERVALYFPHECKGVIDVDHAQGWATATLRFVVINEAGKIGNGIDGWTEDLIVRAQWNLDKPREQGDKTYGWIIEYRQPFAVDLQRAELMVKTLKRISKAVAALPIRPTTFGQWVVLTLTVLGVKEVVAATNAGGFSYDETEHHIGEIAEAQYRIDDAIEPHLPKAAPVEQSI